MPHHLAAVEHNRQGLNALAAGSAELASRMFTEAMRLDPASPVYPQNRGLAFIRLQRFDWALADLNEALRRDPGYAAAYTARGIAYSELKQYPQALMDHGAALRLAPNMAAAWANRGTVFGNMNRWGEALADFTQALRLEPAEPSHHFYCGQAQFQLASYAAALPYLNQAVVMAPGVSVYQCYRGMALVELDRPEEAFSPLSAALQINPQSQLAWSYRGAAFYASGQWRAAIDDLTQAIRLGDTADINFIFRGRSLSRLGCWPEAIADFNTALQKCPDDINVLSDRMQAYQQMGQTSAAQQDQHVLRRLAYQRINACAARGGVHVTTAVIQANRELYEASLQSDRYGMVLLTFDDRFQKDPARLLQIAQQIYEYKDSEDPDPEMQQIASLTDERAKKYRRRPVPARLTGGAVMYAADLWVHRGFLPGNHIDSRLLPCIAEPGSEGLIELLPATRDAPAGAPPRATPPPLPARSNRSG